MPKAQIAMTDLFMAILIFMILIITFFIVWNIYQSRLTDAIIRSELELYTFQANSQLTRSYGIPDNWEENKIPQYNADGYTSALLHFDETTTGSGVDNDIDLGGGSTNHHSTCFSNSDCGSSAPVCCNVESHAGYVCEDPDHHSGTCSVGITPDSSVNKNDGNLETNFPTDSPIILDSEYCKINKCIEFDGLNDYVEIKHDSTLSGLRNFTIEMWIYSTKDQSSTEEHIIHKKDAWYIKIIDNMKLSFLINNVGQFFPEYTFDLDRWHHIALTNEFDDSNPTPINKIKFYVDGAEIFSTTAAGTPKDSSSDIFIGKQDKNSNYFPGIIDELRISNITRTEFNTAAKIYAIGLAEGDRKISEKKLQAFENLGYSQAKDILNIGSYEFYFMLLQGNKTITEIGNYPSGQSAKIRSNVIYKNETSTTEFSLWK